jgi:hypothetical protein
MINNSTRQQLEEILYQDAVDIFCKFIYDKNIRTFIAQEIAFTLDISKDQAAFSIIHKPAISLESSGLQVASVFPPVFLSPLPSTSPLFSPFHDPPPPCCCQWP